MKYLILFLLFLLIPTTNLETANSSSVISRSYYAKVLSSNVFLYASPDELNPMFEIPSSYFVLLTDDANENFYNATYGNYTGYVKKEEVTAMQGSPQNPYAINHNIRITSMSGLPLMEKSTFDSTSVLTLNFLENEISYYGKLTGQEYFPNSTDIWYYCSIYKNGKTTFGYLFSYYCDMPTSITNNQEYFEEITEKLIFKITPSHTVGLSDTVKALIVLAIVIPLLLCIYFIMSPHKKAKTKKILHRKKDYYELNENDLN